MAGTAPQNAMQSLAAGGLTGTGIKNKPQVGDGNSINFAQYFHPLLIKNKPQVGDGNRMCSCHYGNSLEIKNKPQVGDGNLEVVDE